MKTFVCLILYEEKLKCRETKWNKKNENCHVSGVSEISFFSLHYFWSGSNTIQGRNTDL